MSLLNKIRKILPTKLKQSRFWEKTEPKSQQQLEIDRKLVMQTTQKKRIPNLRQVRYISSFFSVKERVIVINAFLIIVVAAIILCLLLFNSFFEKTPDKGGAYSEALVGIPLYVNPVLASTNHVDLDLSRLLFSGLMKYDKNLELQNDIAETYEVSEDQKQYTLKIKNNTYWHDGEILDIDDVLFTYRAIQDPAVNSPLQLSLQNVKIEKIDDRTIRFTLEEPYAPFQSILTTGILPEHLWSSLPASNIRLAELNIKPIGNGPFKFKKLEKDKQGNIHSYTVIPYEGYHGKQPYIQELNLSFFPDFVTAIESLNNNKVEGLSFIPRQSIDQLSNTRDLDTQYLSLPQYTAVFFNQENNSALKDKDVRQALAYAVDRGKLVDDVLGGLGIPVSSPVLPDMAGYDPELTGYPYNPIKAQEILDEAGWEKITAEEYVEIERKRIIEENKDNENFNEENIYIDTGNQVNFRQKDDKILSIKLTTVEQSENKKAIELIKNAWQTIGMRVETETVTPTMLTTSLLSTRDYDALLYGQILNVHPDLYIFWHSSQIEYPGLNLAGFADKDTDKLLVTARQTSDEQKLAETQKQIAAILDEELPAIFLYSPRYTYLIPTKIKNYDVEKINVPADRWNNILDWYIKSKYVLK